MLCDSNFMVILGVDNITQILAMESIGWNRLLSAQESSLTCFSLVVNSTRITAHYKIISKGNTPITLNWIPFAALITIDTRI